MIKRVVTTVDWRRAFIGIFTLQDIKYTQMYLLASGNWKQT